MQVSATSALVRFPGEWALLVEDGRTATVEWLGDPSALTDDGPAWIVDSWAVSLAMLQRGHLCLHASVVRIGTRVVAIAGASGAGKSTAAMALRAAGHDLLTDDVAIVDLGTGRPRVIPYTRIVHLLNDTVVGLGLDAVSLPPLVGFPAKSAFRPEEHAPDPLPLDVIVLLVPGGSDAPVSVREIRGARMVGEVVSHAGRPVTGPAILGQERYFALVSDLCRQTPVLMLERPTGSWTVGAVVTALEEAVADLPAPVR